MIDFMQSGAETIIPIILLAGCLMIKLVGFIFVMSLFLDLVSAIRCKFSDEGKTLEQIIKDLKEYSDWLKELNIIIEEPEDKSKPRSTKKP